MAKRLVVGVAATLILGSTLFRLASAEPVGGRASNQDVLDANGVDTYTIRYNGGETADADAVSTAGQDIDIKVYDPSGTLVARDTAPDGEPQTRWYVSSDYEWRTYTIKVINCTNRRVGYKITFW